MSSWLKKLAKWITTPTITATDHLPTAPAGPITEGGILHGPKSGTARAPATPPPPARPNKLKSRCCAPSYSLECGWIEIYIADPNGRHNGCRIEHHDNVRFWVDPNGNLVIYKSLLDNSVVYHDYVKYVTHNSKNWF
jgi:hypothetical protein